MADEQDDQQSSDDQSVDQTQQTPQDQSASQSTQSEGGDRAAARAARGLPDSVDQLTDEQRREYIGQPTVEVEPENAEEAEVLAMQDTGSDSGEEVA
jgi:hypothetical protein